VCIHDQSAAPTKFLTSHAVPYDRPVPLTNYVGLQKGSGIDLGSYGPAALDIDVYSAFNLAFDAAWSPSSSATCAAMSCAGGSCVPHVRVSVVLTGDVNVVAIVDDPNGTSGVKTRIAAFEDVTYAGTTSSIFGTVVDLSDWNTGATIGAFYGNWQDGTDVTGPLASPLAKDTAASPKQITASIKGFETPGIRFDASGSSTDHFGQSLDSIAYVANPTVTPPAFYDVRQNFVFALIGDPDDTSSVNLQGGRNPKFTRSGLHIAAVPYATPPPVP
jgi:hypothetical protein